MSAATNRPTGGSAPTEASGELRNGEVRAPRTPDESTVGLSSSAERPPSPSGEADLAQLQNGELLGGRFSILRFIARGGMGAVYEATDVMLRSRVALKVIRGRIATDAAAMERFRREVLLARRVTHSNVCRVYELYDSTTAAGVPIHFLTMELLEGETLSQRIAREGRLTTGEALPLVQQLCWGLAAAHAAGVIHRDFKSSNVLLASSESAASSIRVVITDFGIARAMQLGNDETGDRLTGGIAIIGTPEYMAPEQVTGGTVTSATDIYALGVVMYEMVTGKLPFTGDTPLAAAAKRLDEPPPRPELTTPGVDARWSATLLHCLAREPERRFKSALDILPELERPPRRWPRLATLSAVGLGLAVATVAAFKVFPSLHRPEAPHPVVPAGPRPVLAILGFRNELGSPELDWLPTAVSEVLGQELAAAETAIRVIPGATANNRGSLFGDRVAQVRRSLGVTEDSVIDETVRARMQGLLAANVLVYGTLKPLAQGSASVGLSVKMVDAISGRELASLEEDLGESASGLSERVSSLAEGLRQTLGVNPSQEQAAALSASREHNLAAVRSYAKGVMSLRQFDFTNAKGDFDAALAADGSFSAAQRRLVELWEHEGNRKKAREMAERIRSRPNALTPGQLTELDAQLVSLGPEPGKGLEARRALFDATPDDVELGLGLIGHDLGAVKVADATISRLRALPAPASTDIRLDLFEADNAWDCSGCKGSKRAEELLARASARAEGLGAKSEMAAVLFNKAVGLWLVKGRPTEAVGLFQEAATLEEKTGELEGLALVKEFQGQAEVHSPAATLKALQSIAALYRKLGKRASLAEILVREAESSYLSGDCGPAETKLREASAEWAAISETPSFYYNKIKGWLAWLRADLEGAQNAVHLLRTDPGEQEGVREGLALQLESAVFVAQDRYPEARAILESLTTSLGRAGNGMWAFDTQLELCTLACWEGHHPQDGLDCLAKHPPSSPGMGVPWFNLDLAECHLLTGDLEAAEKAAVTAKAGAQNLSWYYERVLANTYLMRIEAARGEAAKAIFNLRGELAEAEGKTAKLAAFEVALAMGEVELRAGRAEGRARLLKLEQDAKAVKAFRLARLAREALDAKGAGAGSRH
ncbi:MAG: protein kinase domain-containing protein [Myxococcaceae bacterium]